MWSRHNNYKFDNKTFSIDYESRVDKMVQRQRPDPGGSSGSIRKSSGEPDAAVIQVKSDTHKMVPKIVVNEIDSRQVVDEIRESIHDNDRQNDGPGKLIDLTHTTNEQSNLPRSSWFDVFDWSVGDSVENQPSPRKTGTVTKDERLSDEHTDNAGTGSAFTEPTLLKVNEAFSPKTYNNSVENTQPQNEDNTDNSVVTTGEAHVTSLLKADGSAAISNKTGEVLMLGTSEKTAETKQTNENVNVCAFVVDEVIEPETINKSNEQVPESALCMCFPENTAHTKNLSPVNHNRDFLSAIFACIDPTPNSIAEDGDLLLDEIEKSLTVDGVHEDVEGMKETIDNVSGSVPKEIPQPDPIITTSSMPPTQTKVVSKKTVVNALTPESSNMIFITEDASTDEILLDKDLQSVPSVKEEVEDSVSPIGAADLGTGANANSATLVERNAKVLKLPLQQRDEESLISIGTGIGSSKLTSDPSFDARRALLIKELRSAISTFGRYDIRCANISAALGDLMDEAKDYDHAIQLHKDAGTIYSCKLGDDHETTLNAKLRLGTVLENSGRVEEAINNYYQVTVMQRALHGDKDPCVAESLVCMAHALRKKGDYQGAIKELKRALKIFRQTLGDTAEAVASTVDEIASLYVTIGDFNKSAAILEEVVKLKAATMGLKSKSVAITLANLATAYECSEKFEEAMKALKKSYKIYTEMGGYSSEDATNTLNRMANLYEAMNDPNRAAVAFLGVLRGRKIQRGADHLSVGEAYFRLGHTLRQTKQYDKALKCLKEALPIFVGQGVEMNDVKMVAEIMHEMAMINEDRGHYQDACRIFKQELSVLKKIGQPEYPFSSRALKHIGITEYRMNNYSRSLKFFVEALTICQTNNVKGLECADILVYTGLSLYKVDNKERALETLKEAVNIFVDQKVKEDYPLFQEATKHVKILENK